MYLVGQSDVYFFFHL